MRRPRAGGGCRERLGRPVWRRPAGPGSYPALAGGWGRGRPRRFSARASVCRGAEGEAFSRTRGPRHTAEAVGSA